MTQAAVLNHLWQSTVFAVVAAGLAWGLRRHQARVRFWVWMAASLKFLVPFGVLAGLGELVRWPAARTAAPSALISLSQPFQTMVTLTGDNGGVTAPAGHGLAWALGAVWAAGAAILVLRWGWRWLCLARIARVAKPAWIGDSPVRITAAAIEPGVFGILRPVLLMPAGLRERLSSNQLEAVMAHERCHLRRRDNLLAALHLVVETAFWFHPLVWWLGARLVSERERACDEDVLRQGGDRTAYAAGIVQVCRYYLESPLPCAAGISGGGLKQRVAAILQGGWGRNLSRGRMLLLAVAGAIALAGPLAAGVLFGQAGQQAAQSAAPLPTEFDAATIKPSDPAGGNLSRRISFRGISVDPGRLTASNMSLKQLIVAAYGLKPYQVVVPDWMDTERFDVTGETSTAMPRDKMETLLKPLLELQFKLKTHRDSKVMDTYTLIVKDKSKLKLASSAGVTPALPDPPPPPSGRSADEINEIKRLRSRGPLTPGMFMVGMSPQGMTLTGNSNLQGLTDMLAGQLDRPVLNGTNLEGNYEIRLTYAPPAGLKFNGGPPDDTAAPAPSLFSALQQQLGLKLDPRKAPVELLVVDHAERAPVGN